MSADEEAVDRTHGRETGADDADRVLDDGPAGVFVGEPFDYYYAVGAGYADAGSGECLWILKLAIKKELEAYMSLNRKIPTSWTLRFSFMCKFHIIGIGSRTVTTSETTLIAPGMHAANKMLTQLPLASSSQALWTDWRNNLS